LSYNLISNFIFFLLAFFFMCCTKLSDYHFLSSKLINLESFQIVQSIMLHDYAI